MLAHRRHAIDHPSAATADGSLWAQAPQRSNQNDPNFPKGILMKRLKLGVAALGMAVGLGASIAKIGPSQDSF
jgi:hypothetical protein